VFGVQVVFDFTRNGDWFGFYLELAAAATSGCSRSSRRASIGEFQCEVQHR